MGKQDNAAADSVNASVSKIDATDAYQISTRGEAKKRVKSDILDHIDSELPHVKSSQYLGFIHLGFSENRAP